MKLVGTYAVGQVEQPGGGKVVESAELHLEPRVMTPDKRVTTLYASDGWSYRFARFDESEPLMAEHRTRPDGTAPERLTQCPENVRAVRDAISLNRLSDPSADDATTGSYRDLPAVASAIRADGGRQLSLTASNETPALVGINVAHKTNNCDTYGGRSFNSPGETGHMKNTEPGRPGWLGNPFPMDKDADDQEAERKRVIGAFYRYFTDRIERDETLRAAVEDLRGQKVGCWCRGSTIDRHEGNWCHLDVIDCWLRSDLETVRTYLGVGHDR